MVRSNQDDEVVEANYVIRVIGQMLSDIHIQWRFRRNIVAIDTGNLIP